MQVIDQSVIQGQLAFAADPKPPAGPLELLITYFDGPHCGCCMVSLVSARERAYAQQRELLSNVKKNDRVITASGIVGTVSSVDRDLDRVVLKVDENSNAKITFTLASVNRVLTDSDNERSVGVGA